MGATIDVTDYKAGVIKGKQRVFGGRFGNDLGQTPWVSFDEEVVTLDESNGNIYRNQVGSVQVALEDPSTIIELRSPIDDSVIGTATHQDVMVMIYSLGRQAQNDRDKANAE